VSFGSALRPPEDRHDATNSDAVAELRALLATRAECSQRD
jgi:hypothetical protein